MRVEIAQSEEPVPAASDLVSSDGPRRVVLVGTGSDKARVVRGLLQAAGYEIVEASDCAAARDIIGESDLVMADLTATPELAKLAEGLLGRAAADPESSPFGSLVLLVPPAALLAQRLGASPEPGRLRVRELEIDLARCEVLMRGRRVEMTPTEFRLLRHLALNAGKVVSAAELLRKAQDYLMEWSEQDAQEIVKVHIRHLRYKLELAPQAPTYIVNVRGFGYMLERRETTR